MTIAIRGCFADNFSDATVKGGSRVAAGSWEDEAGVAGASVVDGFGLFSWAFEEVET